jgi:hypothetical protein
MINVMYYGKGHELLYGKHHVLWYKPDELCFGIVTHYHGNHIWPKTNKLVSQHMHTLHVSYITHQQTIR